MKSQRPCPQATLCRSAPKLKQSPQQKMAGVLFPHHFVESRCSQAFWLADVGDVVQWKIMSSLSSQDDFAAIAFLSFSSWSLSSQLYFVAQFDFSGQGPTLGEDRVGDERCLFSAVRVVGSRCCRRQGGAALKSWALAPICTALSRRQT